MNVELGFLQARSVVVYLWKCFCRKAWVRRWWNGKLVFKFQHLTHTTISKKWKPFWDVFSVLLHNYSSKKRKLVYLPRLRRGSGWGCYKGSQNTPNVLNINALHILKGSRKLHTIDHVSLITYWYTVYCTCCKVHTKGSHFLVNHCEPFVNP